MHEKRYIYIIQMHTGTIPAKLVRNFTRYEYSHVAISLNKDCSTLYSFGRKSLNNVLNGGFVSQKRTDEFFKKFKNTKCRIYEICVTEEQYNCLSSILQDMKQHEKKYKYDFVGILPRTIGLPITFKNKYVCSYFVADILEKSKIYSFNKKTCFATPKDFENIDGAKLIYVGSYDEYTACDK